MKKNFWKNKNILITGGAGFIGSNLANNLSNICNKVCVIDNLERGNIKNLNKKISFIKLDLAKNKNLEKYFKDIDVVFHLASKVGGINYYLSNQYDVLKDNITIDTNVINQSVDSNIKHFFYASSSHIYPKSMQSSYRITKIQEKDSKFSHPYLSYGWAKLIGEELIRFAYQKKKTNFVIGRLVGIFGPNQDIDLNKGSIIPVLCHRALIYPKAKYEILTPGKETRSFCYIDDALEFIKLSIEKNNKNMDFTYNIGSDEFVTIRQIADHIIRISNKDIKLKVNDLNIPEIKSQFCDCTKIKKLTGYKTRTTFYQGLEYVYKNISERI